MSPRKHAIRAAVLTAAVSVLMAAVFWNVKLTPALASAEGESVDSLLRLLLSIGGVIFGLCMVFLVYSALAFRRRSGDTEDGPPMEGHTSLEMAWTLVPLAIVVFLAFQGAVVLKDITQPPPAPEMRVNVTAFQWGWRFEYPEYGIASGELRLPVDQPVLLQLTSLDVIHSFWVPEFRLKQDAVPGKPMTLRVTPNGVGSYKAYCAELCGLAHSIMQAPVKVVEPAEFERWVQEQRR